MKAFHASVLALLLAVAPASVGSASAEKLKMQMVGDSINWPYKIVIAPDVGRLSRPDQLILEGLERKYGIKVDRGKTEMVGKSFPWQYKVIITPDKSQLSAQDYRILGRLAREEKSRVADESATPPYSIFITPDKSHLTRKQLDIIEQLALEQNQNLDLCAPLALKGAKACVAEGCSWQKCGLPDFKFWSVKAPPVPAPKLVGKDVLPKPKFGDWYGPWGKSPTDYLLKNKMLTPPR